ncbi:MAG: cyclodeaminase/cyclohydrolase family protein [Candidatus Brocadiaceae bacterium]|nr:cyclodeaminase/cyclohydrolase family protein [Candidatus Brocadiaceae bacterium]
MYKNKPLEKYLEDAASGEPTPGGGSIAALAGALATTMVSMSTNITLHKITYKQYEAQCKRILEECEKRREKLLFLMEEDVMAYDDVRMAYNLPKSNETEKDLRSETIQKTTIRATEVPVQTTRCCLSLLQLIRELVDIVVPKVISDVGVAGILTEAALQCAKLNVDINLKYIQNQEIVKKVRSEINSVEKRAEAFYNEIQEKVREKIRG